VTGVDISDDMMAICRQKLECVSCEARARARIVKGNIADLDLSEMFDLVIAPCNLINCFTGPSEGFALLRAARRHLKDSGVFILDNSIPDIPHMVESNGVTKTFDFTHPVTGTTITDNFTARYDFTLQIETDHIVLEERDGGRLLRREETTAIETYYFPREIRTMLASAAFQIVHEQGSVVEDIPIDENAGEMVFFCRKAREASLLMLAEDPIHGARGTLKGKGFSTDNLLSLKQVERELEK
jgi:SAM-dependent methyltransferase